MHFGPTEIQSTAVNQPVVPEQHVSSSPSEFYWLDRLSNESVALLIAITRAWVDLLGEAFVHDSMRTRPNEEVAIVMNHVAEERGAE